MSVSDGYVTVFAIKLIILLEELNSNFVHLFPTPNPRSIKF